MLAWKRSTYTFAFFSFCTFKYNFLWLLRFHIIPFWFPCFVFLFIPVKDDYGRRRNENRVHARNICVQRRKLFTAIRHKGFSSEGFLREASLRTGRLVISNRRLSSDAHPCITLYREYCFCYAGKKLSDWSFIKLYHLRLSWITSAHVTNTTIDLY